MSRSKPLTRIQKLIGERMLESKRNKPSFYIEAEADVTELMAVRHKLSKSLGVKITTNAFYIRAIALAAKKYPLMVGKLNGPNNIKIADAINIGFAVEAFHGLVVPVIKDADKKSLAEIARLERTLTEKARHNELTLDQVTGETIAISNLGVYGIDSFIGIIPPPTSTILAIGNPNPTVVAPPASRSKAKQQTPLLVRKMLSLTLTADHRVIHPEYASRFLSFITEQLQNPQQMSS